MSADDLTTEEQLEDALESAKCWRQAHDDQLGHVVAERAKTRAAERKAQLLQSKLDGTAMADETVMGGLVKDALDLVSDWYIAAELSDKENVYTVDWRKGHDLRERSRKLVSTPRYPK
jgi:hypothetical protein